MTHMLTKPAGLMVLSHVERWSSRWLVWLLAIKILWRGCFSFFQATALIRKGSSREKKRYIVRQTGSEDVGQTSLHSVFGSKHTFISSDRSTDSCPITSVSAMDSTRRVDRGRSTIFGSFECNWAEELHCWVATRICQKSQNAERSRKIWLAFIEESSVPSWHQQAGRLSLRPTRKSNRWSDDALQLHHQFNLSESLYKSISRWDRPSVSASEIRWLYGRLWEWPRRIKAFWRVKTVMTSSNRA